jgi:phosphopantothenoylcysteine decarboxylase/phosphopantothenate--cysteine ligase
VSVALPSGAAVVHVERTAEMADAVRGALATADILVMAAAPADFQAHDIAKSKIKKTGLNESLELTPTPDILKTTTSARRPGTIVVGFALETDDVLANAARKLAAKSLDMVVANDAGEPGAGFGVDTNRVTILRNGTEPEPLALMSKDAVADAILDRVEAIMRGPR